MKIYIVTRNSRLPAWKSIVTEKFYTDSVEATGTLAMDSQMAQKTWEMANNVDTISSVDEIYRYDKKQQQDILAAKPWEKEWVLLGEISFSSLHLEAPQVQLNSVVVIMRLH